MSRAPTHLKRLAIQQGNHRIKQRNTSHAIPTDYGAVELTERIALRALFGGPAPRSATENAIIGSADGQRGDPGIRSNVGSPNTQVVDKGLVTRDIIFAPEGDGRDASAAIPGA